MLFSILASRIGLKSDVLDLDVTHGGSRSQLGKMGYKVHHVPEVNYLTAMGG